MAEIKTKKTSASVIKFIETNANAQTRADSKALLSIFKAATGEKPAMWGSSIIGFGSYHYKSDRSKQEGDWPLTGFSPRKQNLTLYIMPGFDDYASLLKKLGPHKTSVSCLYIKRLSDIKVTILRKIIVDSVKKMKKKYKLI